MLDGSRAVSAFSTDSKLAVSPREKLQRSAPPRSRCQFPAYTIAALTALMKGTVPTAKAPVVRQVEVLKG